MKLIYVTEERLTRDIDGNIYATTSFIKFLDRYLSCFSSIDVVARVHDVHNNIHNKSLIESEIIKVIPIPYYLGPKEYLRKRKKIRKVIKDFCIPNQVYISRVPGNLGRLVSTELNRKSIPYGVEVVGDPWDVFKKGGVKHILRPLLRIFSTIELKSIVRNADAVLYVTEFTLQKRYPAKDKTFTTNASNVLLKDTDLKIKSKCYSQNNNFEIISVGSLEQMYKSPDIVIEAISLLKVMGIDCQLTWLGEGKFKNAMIEYAKKKDVHDRCNFVGSVPSGEGVRSYLDDADIFVLASRTEGLPKALIEAMSRGLVCVGTRVGGIPELLDEIALVKTNSSSELADKIKFLSENIELMNSLATNNLKKSRSYEESILQLRRIKFYNELINLSI